MSLLRRDFGRKRFRIYLQAPSGGRLQPSHRHRTGANGARFAAEGDARLEYSIPKNVPALKALLFSN